MSIRSVVIDIFIIDVIYLKYFMKIILNDLAIINIGASFEKKIFKV